MATNKKNAAKNAKASARVRAVQQQKRQRMQWSIGIIAIVVIGIVVLVVAKANKNDATTKTASTTPKAAPASITTDLASVPLSAIAAAHKSGTPANSVKPITDGKPRMKAGKPEVLYIGAEFCPYCAGERWALVTALSKFGNFSGLKTIHSSESNVPTMSFVGSKYTSNYVAFTPIELQDQNHQPLEKATDAQLKLFQQLGGGSFPFIDFGGKFMQSGGSVDVTNLVGKDQTDIARKLAASTTSDTDQKSLQGNVNAVTGEFISSICKLTDNQPAKVCKAFPQT